MHYYKFNIADYRKDTVHLSRLEHSIYRDLIDWYYLDEAPIPKETQSVTRRLRLGSEDEVRALQNVLQDFFLLTDDGFRHHRIDQDIAEYHLDCTKNRANGSKGGRPKGSAKPKKTQSVSSGLPVGTQSQPTGNPNHKPITNTSVTDVTDGRPSVQPSPADIAAVERVVRVAADGPTLVDDDPNGDLLEGIATPVVPPTQDAPMLAADIIFGYGVPLLVQAGSSDKHARSFLAGVRKMHGDGPLVKAIQDCIAAQPLQPLEWLAKALPPKGRFARKTAHSGFEDRNYTKGVNDDGSFS